ncbi:hypothetical protein [Pseudarthrobacter sp. N5]|uniref:hypothetical protein n=1 Tax=Pseudarthrobacter sp. N5 TaxID=3418416 RepID=UPI003CED8E06
MSTDTPTTSTPDIYELVKNVDLAGVRYLEVSGRAKPQHEDDREPRVSINVQETHDLNNIQVRFRFQVDHAQAIYETEIALSYVTSENYEHERPVLEDFIERVAVMAVFPYAREAVSTTAAKLELDVPILGILRLGEFSLGSGSGADELGILDHAEETNRTVSSD